MSKIDELNVSKLIEEKLEIKFQNRQFKLDSWGKVDNWCELNPDCYLFLEVESKQKHPNTNVLKTWPFLLENNKIKIFLIQTYFLDSPGVNSNRGMLSEWLGKELENQLKNRFKYHKIIIDKFNDWINLKNELMNFNK